MTRHDGGLRKNAAEVLGRGVLPALGAEGSKIGGEHRVSAQERLDTHTGGDVGGAEQTVQVMDREGQHPEHPVRSVDKGKPFLLGEENGSEPGRGGRHQLARVVAHLTLAHHREGAVGQGSEIARAAQGPVFANHGCDPRVQHVSVGLCGRKADAGAPGEQGGEAEQHQGSHTFAADFRTGSRRMGAHQ
jgi:hypothetical protein